MPDETPEIERLRSWCAMLEGANAAWQVENAKLRKLVSDLRYCKRNDCLTCTHGRFCDMRFEDRMHELGIEVDR